MISLMMAMTALVPIPAARIEAHPGHFGQLLPFV